MSETIQSDVQSGHPKGLYVLFVTEMWERFSFYGMRAIFTLYMVKALMMNNQEASKIYGSYTGLVFLTPLIGGFIADRYWGNRRSIFVGGLLMALGQFAMYFSASNYTNQDIAIPMMWVGLSFLIIGNGFFKPNISTMVGQLYPEGDRRVDSAFTIFYMGINLGAFFSPLVCGYLGDTNNPADFKWGFLAAGIGMLVSVTIFELLKDKYIVSSDGRALGIVPEKKEVILDDKETVKMDLSATTLAIWGVIYVAVLAFFHFVARMDNIGTFIFATAIVAPAWIISDKTLTKVERERIIAIYIIAFFVIFFWSAFEQAGASLTVFADKNIDRFIGSYEVPASYFQSVNAALIVIFAPLFAWLWSKLGKRNMEPASPVKQAIGLFLLSMSYLVIAFGVKGVDAATKVSMLWLISLYMVQTFGELCLSPIGLSMVNKLAPIRLSSLLMGVWFLSSATANKFGGDLSALLPQIDPKTNQVVATSFYGLFAINNLYDFFMVFMVMSLVASIILFALQKWIIKLMHGIR